MYDTDRSFWISDPTCLRVILMFVPVIQDSRITRAQTRGREILKFSSLVTDAYFHYTPSQIMLAALSIADHGLFERMIELTFPSRSNEQAGGNTDHKAEAVTQMIKGKTISTVLGCKEVLLQEPPERISDFYGTVNTSHHWHQTPVRR